MVRPRTKNLVALIPSGFMLIAAVIGTDPVLAETPEQLCNRLAGDSVATLGETDAATAANACSVAVATSSDDAQLAFQYGRALERLGRLDAARAMYTWASEDGLAAATKALSRLDGPSTEAPRSGEAADSKTFARRLSGAAAIAESIARTAAQEQSDPIAVLAKGGSSPAAILGWVQENTRLVPYAGMLRGAPGVLMDRVGNNLDRTLLLADLLRRAGFPVRIARATLTADEAAALRTAFLASIPRAQARKQTNRDELLRSIGNDARVERALVERSVDQAIRDAEQFDGAVRALFEQVSAGVIEAAGESAERNKALVGRIDASFREHFWVQRRVAAGWEDLDVDQAVVQRHPAASTFDVNGIPDDLKHRVTIRLFAETFASGKRSEQKLLERNATASELQGKPIVLRHTLLPMPALSQILKEPDPKQAYLAALSKAWVVSPELTVGDEAVNEQLYTMDGRVLPATAFTLASLGVSGFADFTKLQAGLTQAFGGETQSAGKAAETMVTAEWLEIEITVANEAPQKYRRAVFDLLGPAARSGEPKPPAIDARAAERRGLALSGTADLFVFGATPSVEWLTRITASELADVANKSVDLIRRDATLDDALGVNPAARLQLPLWGWALNRSGTGLVPDSPPVGPNVAIYWQEIAPAAQSPLQSTRAAIDIVANSTLTNGDFKQGVAQGVLDTVVEHALNSSGATDGNAAALFAAGGQAGAWQLIEPQQRERVEALAVTEDVKARIRGDLDNGNLVLTPSGPIATARGPEIAWWRIDPRTGATIGVSENGMGGDLGEEATLLQKVTAKAVCAFVGLGLMIAEGHFSVTSTILTVICMGSTVHPGYGRIVAHGVIDAVIDIFANAAAPSPFEEHGGAAEH